MEPLEAFLHNQSRRQWLARTASGAMGALGVAAMADLASADSAAVPHFPPMAKRVIYLFQEGGPSHLDTYDYKPQMKALDGQDLRKMPDIHQGQRLTGMTASQGSLPLRQSPFKFQQHPNRQDGVQLSELLPHTGGVAEDICFIRSMHTDAINHGPAVTLMQTGSQLAGRPTMGAWLSYGLGSESKELPAFVVLVSQGVGQMQALLSRYWGSAFLPSEHQGVRLRSSADTVLFLKDPDGMSRDDRRQMLDLVAKINQADAERNGDSEVLARVAQYEMAFRMQSAVPDLTDISNETEASLALYGPHATKPGSFANNCLLARRLAERGVRFIQLYHRGWDSHGNVPRDLPAQCGDVDQPQAGLLRDLKQRGMLEDTLVIWGGEFGRTSYAQGPKGATFGRDHHPRCFTVWMAGGGIKPGIVHGATDEVGYNVAENPVHVHDLHATVLKCLGIDHTKLTHRYQGRDFRLTDVHGKVVKDILA
ncbi:DUF1501 domain-containing protein [Roseimaritima ulvae]|uniref:Sulfatase n=1 Tax=Roseimaritima ulvae TaxID=980254 RepID=A0A5B9QUA2_9BACT|nr:DUF1501 domain-containing protein [Roseimaritima ulvae]QEG42584.1 hypothetical protein UC8_46260 [Roseimaritima ulvae]